MSIKDNLITGKSVPATLNKTLKAFPLLSILAIGIALAPVPSVADSSDRGRIKDKISHDSGRSSAAGHNRGNYRANKHSYRESSYRGERGHRARKHYERGYSDRYSYSHDYRRSHTGGHGREHIGHTHTTYVVNDRHHGGHGFIFDPLRFAIGLHTNNLDITIYD